VVLKKNQFRPYVFQNVSKLVISVKSHLTASGIAYVAERECLCGRESVYVAERECLCEERGEIESYYYYY